VEDGSVRSSGATLALAWTSDGDATTVVVQGELDTETAAELEHVVDQLLGDGVRHLTIDLTELEFLDSSGLRVLIRAQRVLDDVGGTVVLRQAPPFARRLLSVTGLDTFFAVR